jgi:hypothetical protein
LRAWKSRQPIRDQWNYIDEANVEDSDVILTMKDDHHPFTELGKRLLGMEPW